jgi:thiamine biosynthesis lipoprotein
MGSFVAITVYAPDSDAAQRAVDDAYTRVEQLIAVYSDYDPHSELSRLCQSSGSGRAVAVSDDLWVVLYRAREMSQLTGGLFDVTIGPYKRLWRRSRRQRELPRPEHLAKAAAAVGWRHVELDARTRSVTLRAPGMDLDLAALAPGHIADEALRVLRERHRLPRALVDVSGDVVCGDPPPDRPGWRIATVPLRPQGPPSSYLIVSNCSVSTSGDAFQFIEIDGVRYSHILDPRTGLGVTRPMRATVVARDGITADALATASCLLDPEAALRLIEQAGAQASLLISENESVVERHTAGYQAIPHEPAP